MFLLFIFLFTAVSSALSQPRSVTVLSGKDRSPVPYAYILFQEMDDGSGKKKEKASSLTRADGTAIVPFSNDVMVRISHLGFQEFTDTLLSNESKIIYLHPLNIPIDEVVVTAQYTPAHPANSVYPVEVITREALERRGATNLSEALKQETHIRISQDNILGSKLSLQGLSGSQVKIMMDGIPVTGRENGNIDLSQLNLNNVKRIEIIEGPVSVQYGTNAMGGVINIITNHGRHDGWNTRLNGYYESAGVYNADAGIGFGRKKHSVDGAGGRNFFDGYSAEDTSRFKEWKPKEQYFGTLKYGFGYRRLNFTLKGDAFYEKVTDRGEPRPPYNITAFDNYFHNQRYIGAASVSGEILQHHYLDQLFSYSHYSRIRNRYYKDLVTLENTMTVNPGDQDTTRFHTFYVRGSVSRNKPEKIFNYQLGYDINAEKGEGGKIENESRTIGDYALFTSLNLKPVKEIALQGGVRWTYNTAYGSRFIPSFHIKWSPRNELTLRASYAQGFRTPFLKELYLDFVDLNHDIRGNPDLGAEYSHNVSFSLNYQREINHHHVAIIPSFYFNDITNMIKLVETGVRRYTYQNIEQFMTIGILLSAEYRFNDFTLSAAAGNSGQRKERGEFNYSPEISLQASYLVPKALITISLYNKYNGPQTTYVLDEVADISQKEIDAYTIMDVSVNRQFLGKRISLTAGVKNMLNVNEVNSTGGGSIHNPGDNTTIGWGRSFFASLKFSIDKKN